MSTRAVERVLIATLVLVGTTTRAADCATVAETCVEGRETRSISGHAVTRECWRWQSTYQCPSERFTDDCQDLRDRSCSQVGSNCTDTSPAGTCMLFEQTWQCRTSTGGTSTITQCGTQQFCLSDHCFDTGHVADADFGKAIAGLEAQREAGKYLDADTLTVFRGHDNRCKKKLAGLVNCCRSGGGGGLANLPLILGAGTTALAARGSSYAFDALFSADDSGLGIAGFQPMFAAGGGSGVLDSLRSGGASVSSIIGALDPVSWSAALVGAELAGLLSCEEPDKVLAMKRDNRLCHGVGSHCSTRIPVLGICIETTETYCCFNSRLSRILNEQGRAQLGRGWGTSRAPDCGGITLEQLQALDFSRMDLTEFQNEIAPTLPDTAAMRERATRRVQDWHAQ